MLGYFNERLQERVLGLLHGSLGMFGYLGLGPKETLPPGGYQSCFTEVRRKAPTLPEGRIMAEGKLGNGASDGPSFDAARPHDESAHGQGSVMNGEAAYPSNGHSPALPGAQEEKVKVLLVDDLPHKLTALHAILENENLSLVTCHFRLRRLAQSSPRGFRRNPPSTS